MDVHGGTEAAVLAPLYLDEHGEPHLVFTKRRDDLKRHAGEISFPGGRRDPEDSDLTATALREAHEEIGLESFEIEVLGSLPTYTTSTGFITRSGRRRLCSRRWKGSVSACMTICAATAAGNAPCRCRR